MRICAIDYGKKRVGIAISDILHITSRPYDTLINDEDLFDNLLSLSVSEKIGLWVVGLPSGSISDSSIINDIKDFCTELKERTFIDTIQVDESFSSKIAVERMRSSGMKKKMRARKGMIDRFAAQYILQEFLENHELYR